MKLKIKKLKENAKLPQQAHETDAGFDVFWCTNSPGPIYLSPGENVVFGTGLSLQFPRGYVAEVKNRSSVASKKGLVVGACIIDSGYTGEVFIDLHNVSDKIVQVKPGDKIAQILFYKIERPEIELVSELEDSTRGDKGFGSSGK